MRFSTFIRRFSAGRRGGGASRKSRCRERVLGSAGMTKGGPEGMARMRILGVSAMVVLSGMAGAQVNSGAAPVQTPAGRPGVSDHHRMATMRPLQPPQAEAGQAGGGAQAGMRSEDVLAGLVKGAGVIFSGEVYAIRMPEGEQNAGTQGGQHSGNPSAVEVEFRVDQGVRGATIGNPYVLRERVEEWRSRPGLLALHGRYVVLLEKPDAAGLSRPVGGERGVFPIDKANNVDLSRLHAGAGASQGTAEQGPGRVREQRSREQRSREQRVRRRIRRWRVYPRRAGRRRWWRGRTRGRCRSWMRHRFPTWR